MSLSAKDKELVEDWAAEPKPVAQTKPKPKLEPKPSIKPEPQPVDPERTICCLLYTSSALLPPGSAQ